MGKTTSIDSSKPVRSTERIQVLDVLRGIAIFGMIISHFDAYGINDSDFLSGIVAQGVGYLIDDRFYTMFAILFGASFAIQFIRAKEKGEKFIPRFLRRMITLACFGFIISVAFGYAILYDYALCGLLLILIRNWSTKGLIITLFICVMINPLYKIAFNTTYSALYGVEQTKLYNKQRNDDARILQLEQRERNSIVKNTPNYITAIKIRTEGFQLYPTTINKVINLLSSTFMLFLIGFIAMRLNVFKEPEKHRRLVIGCMILGVVLCALTFWALPFFPITDHLKYPNVSFPLEVILYFSSQGFGLVRDNWLAFTYTGAVLLLISYNPVKWLNRFKFFAWAGRMALTNYMLQAMIINFLFASYALALSKFPEVLVPVFSLLLIVVLVLFSRWWLNRYKYGPVEWIWRSITYWEKQPLKNEQITTDLQQQNK